MSDTERRVLVTGGRTGIGRAIADAYAAKGCRVFICGVSEEAMEETLKNAPHLQGVAGDVADPEDVDRIFAGMIDAYGGVDVLVNNAGVSGPTAEIDKVPLDEWDRTLKVNLYGPFYCARKAAAFMKAQKSGSIINISTTSVRVALPNRAPYVVSKSGLHGLTRMLARELGPYNIRCNTISPGMVDNERGGRVRKARAQNESVTPDDILKKRLSFISMRSMVSEQDIAGLACFLGLDDGAHITGQDISVCGNIEWE